MKGLSKNYLRVNGTLYVVEESAERHGVISQRTGASRYTRDYYGILAVTALAKLYERGGEISVFGSQAPREVKFREDLMQSVIGKWEVKMTGNTSRLKVVYANTFDEPVGGLMNVLLTEDGTHYQYAHVSDGRTLMIDIGSFTTDFLAVNPGDDVDYSLARSVPLGIQTVLQDFEDSFRTSNSEIVKDAPLPPEQIRNAIVSGMFKGSGKEFHCEEDAQHRKPPVFF